MGPKAGKGYCLNKIETGKCQAFKSLKSKQSMRGRIHCQVSNCGMLCHQQRAPIRNFGGCLEP